MKTITEPLFLKWAADAGLVPDPRYPASRQLVFAAEPDWWAPYSCPTTPSETAAFLRVAIDLIAHADPVRVRIRGGGPFSVDSPNSEAEAAISSAVDASGLPRATTGAVQFEPWERETLVQLAVAFARLGYRIETDLEIVNLRRDASLLIGHHRELLAHFPNKAKLDVFRSGMAQAGFASELDE